MKYWTMQRHQLFLHKTLQNPAYFFPDFISGPMDRSKSLSMGLHIRAK